MRRAFKGGVGRTTRPAKVGKALTEPQPSARCASGFRVRRCLVEHMRSSTRCQELVCFPPSCNVFLFFLTDLLSFCLWRTLFCKCLSYMCLPYSVLLFLPSFFLLPLCHSPRHLASTQLRTVSLHPRTLVGSRLPPKGRVPFQVEAEPPWSLHRQRLRQELNQRVTAYTLTAVAQLRSEMMTAINSRTNELSSIDPLPKNWGGDTGTGECRNYRAALHLWMQARSEQ